MKTDKLTGAAIYLALLGVAVMIFGPAALWLLLSVPMCWILYIILAVVFGEKYP